MCFILLVEHLVFNFYFIYLFWGVGGGGGGGGGDIHLISQMGSCTEQTCSH